MKKIVAVSGGVDSVVLLHMLVKKAKDELVVAHFDHGIRKNSQEDRYFVAELANQYGLTFENKREELGVNASEDTARSRRYAFLRSLAEKYSASIVTAHHLDDMVETFAINIVRGTGWRGLAVLGDRAIERPLLGYRKADLYHYALVNNLEFVQDETNGSPLYLRNRLRSRTMNLNGVATRQLYNLWQEQMQLRDRIEAESKQILSVANGSRYFFTMIDEGVAIELLREWLLRYNKSLTRLQRQRLLLAIKTAQPETVYQAGDNTQIVFTRKTFVVKQ